MCYIRITHLSKVVSLIIAWIDCRYFKQRSLADLDESELNRLRMQACERMAKLMIDSITNDDAYLFTDVLLRRYFQCHLNPVNHVDTLSY